jgi:hypothetical protein
MSAIEWHRSPSRHAAARPKAVNRALGLDQPVPRGLRRDRLRAAHRPHRLRAVRDQWLRRRSGSTPPRYARPRPVESSSNVGPCLHQAAIWVISQPGTSRAAIASRRMTWSPKRMPPSLRDASPGNAGAPHLPVDRRHRRAHDRRVHGSGFDACRGRPSCGPRLASGPICRSGPVDGARTGLAGSTLSVDSVGCLLASTLARWQYRPI